MVGRLGVITTLLSTSLAAVVFAQEESRIARVDSIFAQYDGEWSPGCAVGVIQHGEWVFKRGYGMANLEHRIPLSATSVFRIGSTSKQFTAAAIVLLQQEGKLFLEDDVRRFLPELQAYELPVTIRHLLNHTSGVRDYLVLMSLAGKRDDDFYTDDEVIEMLARQRELNFEPGAEFLYSNSGYFLLSQIVKRATGTSLREYASKNIFAPLSMTRTHYHDDHTEVVVARASGYAPADGPGFRISMTTLEMIGDGGVFTTLEDLRKWDQNFRQPLVGGPGFLRDMLTKGVLNSGDTLDYALGLGHGEYRGLPIVSHSGGFVGFRAQMIRFPTEYFTVICLCNLSTTNPTRLARRVADIFLADKLQPVKSPEGRTSGTRRESPKAVTLSQSVRQELAGEYYSDELDATYRLVVEGDSLLQAGTTRALVSLADDVLRRGSLTFRFQREGGRIVGFLLDAGRVKNLRFERR